MISVHAIHVAEKSRFVFHLRKSIETTCGSDIRHRNMRRSIIWVISSKLCFWRQIEAQTGNQISIWFYNRLSKNSKGNSTSALQQPLLKTRNHLREHRRRELQEPAITTELWSFLGLCKVLKKLSPNFTPRVAHLHKKFEKDHLTEIRPFNKKALAVMSRMKVH